VSRSDSTTCIILEGVGTFVCLIDIDELQDYEKTLPLDLDRITPLRMKRPPNSSDNTSEITQFDRTFLFQRLIQSKYTKINFELQNAVDVAKTYYETAKKNYNQVKKCP